MRTAIFTLSIVLLLAHVGAAQEAQTLEAIQTTGGELRITQSQIGLDAARYTVTLGGRSVFETRESTPTIHSHIKRPLYASRGVTRRNLFAEVVVMSQQTNACEEGAIWLLGIRADGTFARTQTIPPCGLRVGSYQFDRVTVSDGAGRVWEFTDGRLMERKRRR